MENRSYAPFLTVMALLLLTSLALALTVDVRSVDEAGVAMTLPEQVGAWRGEEMRFCQNPACLRDFLVSSLANRDVCPVCGGVLADSSRAEKEILPADTVLLKKIYKDAHDHNIYVSIVLSGGDRSSIHRPQVCMEGQGNRILKSHVVSVPIEGRKPLELMMLEMVREVPRGNGTFTTLDNYYAYWFVGKGRETPYHVQRMIWMASDRIFRNISHRWAYIALSGERDESAGDYEATMVAFLKELYPRIMRQ